MGATSSKQFHHPLHAGLITLAIAGFCPCDAEAARRGDDAEARRHSPTQIQQSRDESERRRSSRDNPLQDLPLDIEIRSIDGSGNNTGNPDWGAADTEFLRLAPNAYGDGSGAPSGGQRPNPRLISNRVVAQPAMIINSLRASDFVWQWGQFLDHDFTLTPVISPVEPFDIPMPAGDAHFDPEATGSQSMPLDRSLYNSVGGVRQQVNINTAYIDASQVYGSDAGLAAALRTGTGGRLRTSAGNLLPFNRDGAPVSSSTDPLPFIAGDSRSNEQVGLTAFHTLFVREHNYWADKIRREHPGLTDEQIYQMARLLVAAEMQAVTYKEFLPVLLGPHALTPYTGYRPETNAGIANEFAAASFRFGHSMISATLLRRDRDGATIPAGDLPLRAAFFNPGEIIDNGIDSVLRGLAAQPAQEIDAYIVDDLRNFLFGAPGQGGFDLASLNIQRGRDHGLPSYNETRRSLGLPAATSFADISTDPEVQARLTSVYASVDDIDLWVGGLAEDHVAGALVGETVYTILKDQFERLRDGDRFWYQAYLPEDMLKMVEDQTLAQIIRRNTGIGRELQDNVFVVPGDRPRRRR
ncbi:MAG: peroxidase family protein [Acetobacteraceae bacterium]